MYHIRIQTKLTSTERGRLYRVSDREIHQGPAGERAFTRVGRSEYAPEVKPFGTLPEEYEDREQMSHAHAVARRMMTVAGRTFDYDLIDR